MEERTLMHGMMGKDVAKLHAALAALGIEITGEEIQEQRFGDTTHLAVTRLQILMGLEVTGEVDPAMLSLALEAQRRLEPNAPERPPTGAGREAVIEGVVTDEAGLPLPRATVVLLERELRTSRELGRTRTGADGAYRLTYAVQGRAATDGAGAGDALPDLQLDVLGARGKRLFTSPVQFHVVRRADIPLALGGVGNASPSEFDRVAKALAPRLGKVRAEELLENEDYQDITFLSGDAGLDKTWVAFYSAAARLAAHTGLPPELFYALFRQNVPADASLRVLATGSDGVDLDTNANRLLDGALAASSDARRNAVHAAVAHRVVRASYANRAETDLAQLSARAVDAALATVRGMGKTAITDVLTAAGVPEQKQRTFAQLYASAGSPTGTFWRDLAKHGDFTKNDVADLRFATQAGQFARGHMPLVTTLLEMRKSGEVKEMRDLARLTADDWKKLLIEERENGPIGVPANFAAPDHGAAVADFAYLLERRFERAYPTAAFAARLQADAATPFAAPAAVGAFLDSNPAFDLRRSNVDRYLRDNPRAVNGDRAELRDSLLTAQRLLKIASRYAAAKPLLEDGIHSARQIYAIGRSRFLQMCAGHPETGAAEATRMYAVAEQTYAMSLSLTARLSAPFRAVNPVAIAPPAMAPTASPQAKPAPAPQPQPQLADFPNLETLFGSSDLCACKSCRSVLSPAAYLADLMRFLSHRVTNGKSARDVLHERRPDLVQIELSCPNTNTVLPYIDLVNELLEDAVAPPADPAAARRRQTTLTTDELNANPQYVNPGAYEALAKAVYPWILPFDLPLSETRVYLGQLGATREQLMRALRKQPALPSAEATAIAVEALGLSSAEADIVTGAGVHQPWEYWGLAETGNTIRDPVDHTVLFSGTWLEVLSHVRVLLGRAAITHQTLTQLLNTRFVNPGGTAQLTCHPEDSCDLATMTVDGLTAGVLDRLHRFVRLQRKLGWDPFELDAAVELLQAALPPGAGRLNSTLLRQLAAVKAAITRFQLAPAVGVAFLARLDTHDVPLLPGEETQRFSLYRRLFQDPAVLNPVDAAFTLNGGGTELAGIATAPKLADHGAALVAAFEISDADVAVAIDGLTDGALTLANLSELYRNVVLAQALGLTVKEMLALRALVETETELAPFYEQLDPFDATRPERLGQFCDVVDAVRQTRFEIAQLDYLLRHVYDEGTGVAPDDVAIGTLLKTIRDGLLKIAAENASGPDPGGAQMRKRLTALLPAPDVETVMAILAGTSVLSAADQSTAVGEKLGAYLDAAAAQAALVGGAALDKGAPRYEYVLARILEYVRRDLGTAFVVQHLCEVLGLPTATVAHLVSSWFRSIADAGKPLVEDFLALPAIARAAANADQPIARSEAGFGAYFTAYAALDKAAQAISGFGLATDEVLWLHANGVVVGWLDPTQLPLAPAATPAGGFVRWRRMTDAVAVKEGVPADGAPFTGLMDLARSGAAKAAYVDELEKRTKWSKDDLAVLAGDPADPADTGLLALVYPGDFRSERALARLLAAFAQLRRLGVAVSDAASWIGAGVSAAQADSVRQSVKGKYSRELWPGIAKPLRDVLREQQRDALVGYLLARPPGSVIRWHDANDVYAHYLIDVQMSACQGTSRIVQANSSIQLFVQRCLLDLEPEVKADADADADWLQWQWMSRYRVWEADRKVFLWPENWIEPGLRHDKSPFFTDLENELLQSEITKDSAEDAFRNYLERLDAVCRLDVVGTFFEAGTPTRLHVVGRKQGEPPTYYYRQWIDSSHWTAWTKIDLGIVSDHVLPVVWNRRLYLFWAIVQRKPDRTQGQPAMSISGSAPPEPKLHLEVQLAWSELKGTKWLAKQTAPQTIVIPAVDDPYQITLKSSIQDPLLRIDIFAGDVWDVCYLGRAHFGEFVLGGVGNAVEAYVVSTWGLAEVGPDTRGIGTLAPELVHTSLRVPTNSLYEGMAIMPAAVSMLSPARQRVCVCSTTYDLNGTLTSEAILSRADRYRLLIPHQNVSFDSTLPFFYSDAMRSYCVIPTPYYQNGNYFTTAVSAYGYHPFLRAEYRFIPFYHAFVPLFIRELNRGGVDRLFRRELQSDPASVQGVTPFDFRIYYGPYEYVVWPYPAEGVDFEPDAGYSIYNWELFFHAPFQIGEALSRNQRFAEAKHWYEYVFDPTTATSEPAPGRFWVTKPFRVISGDQYAAEQILELTRRINQHDAAAEHQVAEWRANPFDPHVIAGLRPVAYQRAIVMKYIDNLISWGDQLFRQETMESVNEATQLYVLAAELLGPRPEIVQRAKHEPAKTFAELESSLDEFADAVVAAENAIPPATVDVPADPSAPKLPVFPPLYFCIPPNEQLLAYWDTVADRLFKIRHCMNIEGIVRQLALFAPPIDPALLVKAAAAGLDLGSVLNDTSAALPPYRFRVVIREALELAEGVRALGSELLSVIEKRDAEHLALLRSGSEKKLQKAVLDLRGRMVDEATQQLDVLEKNRLAALGRQTYYAQRKDELMNGWETAALALTGASAYAQQVAGVLESASGAAHNTPGSQFGGSGAGGSPHVTAMFGGANVGHSTSSFANAARVTAALLQTGAAMSTVLGGYQQRQAESTFQHDIATKELDVIASQQLATTIREDIAKRDRDNQDQIATLAADVDDRLHDKFTNEDLYDWMVGQTSATYFQAYGLAYTVAKRAEQCLRHELGLDDSSFIQFGYWDSLKKGLLAGDKLVFDLQRMQAAYLSENVRELEVTKNASLRQIDPYALVKLRTTGECIVTLPELWFDIETPGHYMRRLRTVAVTVPATVGQLGGVSMTLTLLDNHVRTKPAPAAPYPQKPGGDPRFHDDQGGFSAVVISSGVNDSGLHELNLQDDRYLPFEGAGAISTWKLKLNAVYPQFDYRTITDVVLHLRYTARDGGAPLATEAAAAVTAQLNTVALAESRRGLYKLISARHEYGTAWSKFLHPGAAEDQVLKLETPPERFPFFTSGLDVKVTGIDVLARLADPGDYTLMLTTPQGVTSTVLMTIKDGAIGDLHHFSAHPIASAADLGRAPSGDPPPAWSIKLKKAGTGKYRSLTPAEIDDLVLVFQYTVSP